MGEMDTPAVIDSWTAFVLHSLGHTSPKNEAVRPELATSGRKYTRKQGM